MMESSVAFELLFRVPLKQHEDNEAIIRELSLTFDRPRVKNRPLHLLSFVAFYEPMKWRFLSEILTIFVIMASAQTIIIRLYAQLTGPSDM